MRVITIFEVHVAELKPAILEQVV